MSTPSLLRTIGIRACAAAGLALVSAAALAHPGHEQGLSGGMFAAGLLHPLTGADHLLAMLAVGMWAALSHADIRQAIRTPASFLCLLLLGALAGIAGFGPPAVEPFIMASLLVLGLLLASRIAMPGWMGAALVGFFALFHGAAHGAELPAGHSAAAFIAGFMLSTLALHLIGLAGGFALKHRAPWLARLAGAGIAAYGVALFAGAA
ncbi:HupE/UreJ family protein [Pollutimonas bauzanensis]|uniref:Urease accessory protein n=1 Tax=Pollutimonas bauzanensis TaxID=658167 RepID=A0A1M5ZNH0_9BURK|nr:HupE/UreJ family protein [Pollutimonas bauzanensis]SHI25463.1 urease accessory protein [Pollutimonas bauzanensis]